MPSFKSLCPREVRLFEPQFLVSIARHYKIRIWPGTTEKVGVGGEVTSSNQDTKTNMATLVCSDCVFRIVFAVFCMKIIEILTELMTKVCQLVVVLCRTATTVQTRDREFLYTILLQAPMFCQVGRDSCPCIARISTQPAVLLYALSISLMTVLQGHIMSEEL